MLKIVEKTKLWFSISLIIIIIGMGVIATKGLNLGIDFKGGTAITINMNQKFDKSDVDKIIDKHAKGEYLSKTINDAKEIEITVKSDALSADETATMLKEIKTQFKSSTLVSEDTIGASIGSELKTKAVSALIVAMLFMLVYVGFRFEFKFAASAILALVHDILITITVYAVFQTPVNATFIAAILTVVGYSINDTIVIFDRIRENQRIMRKATIEEITNTSVTQTMARSINTVVTVLICIFSVWVLVPAIRDLSGPLLIGIGVGCYSSIFIASPMWAFLKKRTKKVTA
ncbi:protein translocase subunit SecF [Clostridium estertheticum]|uniref:protein translocase subunit SecF n=1 Tax=Clostridium estertheticum TaxID=238834 RepID=UPI001CF1F5F8|nr:protein translocase subunit SecF [Clostridium estertheticum]MCB2354084.1 protein translocase subunit SecF [Clostridium estertheticum]WAG43218.1 protein translocase subunit SecF [Clostridium estertheticum]